MLINKICMNTYTFHAHNKLYIYLYTCTVWELIPIKPKPSVMEINQLAFVWLISKCVFKRQKHP